MTRKWGSQSYNHKELILNSFSEFGSRFFPQGIQKGTKPAATLISVWQDSEKRPSHALWSWTSDLENRELMPG